MNLLTQIGAVKRYVATEIWVNIGAVTADQMLTYDQYSQVTFHHRTNSQ